ncbi:nucleic acid-binding, OB-fold, replication protein A, OB domain protein [Tanacetum coccineum]
MAGTSNLVPELTPVKAGTSNLLTELTPFKDDWHIKVRIIKLWKLPSYKNPMETFRIELILLDEEGNKIQATVKNTCVKNHEKSLGQDMCLYISEFGVTDNDEKDTFVVKHPYKINFYRTTRVKKCDDFSGPVYGFNFKPFTDLLQEKKDSTFAYGRKKEELKRFIRIEMQDTMGNKLQNVTLWGAYADQLDEYMGDRSAFGHVVIIIQFAKHKIYREKPNVSNMFNATNLFINADIPEINSFKKTLLENLGGEASDHQIVPLVKYDRYDVRQDFLVKLQKVNLADIRDIAEIKSVVVVATIKVIERDNKWYYLACGSCNRIVDEKTVDKKDSDSGELKKQVVFVCSNKECGEVTNVRYNYKIQIRVLDKSGSVSLTLFDRVASKLLNRTAEEFIREMRKNGDMDHFPEHFNILLGCTYAFKVDITKYCLDNHKFVYPVATFTDDGSIIEELEAMQSTEEQLPSNSEQPLSSFLSPPTMGKLKGALSGPEES